MLEEQPPGELKPHRFMSEMELYTRWLLGLRERCGRRQHARREDERRELHEEGSNCQAKPWTARGRTAGELAHRRGAQGHRRQW